MYTLTIKWLDGTQEVHPEKGYTWIMCKITHIKSSTVDFIKIERTGFET